MLSLNGKPSIPVVGGIPSECYCRTTTAAFEVAHRGRRTPPPPPRRRRCRSNFAVAAAAACVAPLWKTAPKRRPPSEAWQARTQPLGQFTVLPRLPRPPSNSSPNLLFRHVTPIIIPAGGAASRRRGLFLLPHGSDGCRARSAKKRSGRPTVTRRAVGKAFRRTNER